MWLAGRSSGSTYVPYHTKIADLCYTRFFFLIFFSQPFSLNRQLVRLPDGQVRTNISTAENIELMQNMVMEVTTPHVTSTRRRRRCLLWYVSAMFIGFSLLLQFSMPWEPYGYVSSDHHQNF